MKPFESILGEVRKGKKSWVILGGLDDQDTLGEYMRKKYSESALKVILLFELDNDAKGFLVRTESRILFCVTQNANKYEEAFIIKWVIDDIQGTTLDIKLVDNNEIQVTHDKNVLFDPGHISAQRLTEEVRQLQLMSRMMKARKKSGSHRVFLTSKDKLEEAKKNLSNGTCPSAVASTASSFEEWLREVLDIDDTIEHINPQNIVEQWKTHKLPHSDEVERMAEILSLVVPTKHPPLYNPRPKECIRYIKRMENLIKLHVKMSDHDKQIIKLNLHIA